MSTAPVVQESDPILGTDFIREMVRQMRALDTYGVYNGGLAPTIEIGAYRMLSS